MRTTRFITTVFLLLAGAVMQLSAQTAVTVGSQVTSEVSLQEGVPYIIYQPRNSTYVKEASDRYSAFQNNSPDDTGVFFFVKVSDGVYKIKSYSTGKFISKPTTTGIAAIAPVEEASAGEWTLQFDSNGCIYPLCNGYGWDRGSNALWATTGAPTTYNESGNVKLYKIYNVALSTTAPFSEFTDKDIVVNTAAATNLAAGTWYVMKNMGRNGYLYEQTSSHSLYNRAAAPSGSATDCAQFLVRLVSGDNNKYYIQNGLGNYFGAIPQNTAVPMTALHEEQISITQIGSNAGYFYLTGTTDSRILDCKENGYAVVGWGTDAPTATNSNAAWQFYPVTLVDSWVPTISEVYTINNTNSNRGALIYNPDASTTNVWSSGKSGTFDAANANSQWVIIPTGTDKQYYLYNVGAGKFAIPTGIASGKDYPWIFSNNAVAVVFETQGDGTKKIKMATNPVSGTNAAYISVSNGHANPIFNYNDAGSNFTITKVDGADQSTAANAAVAKLIKSQTALTTYPNATGWSAIQIKSKTGSASYAGRYLQNATTLYNDLYPLTFTGGIDVQPAVTDPTFFTYINHTDWDNNTWQLPDGRFLVKNSSSKFPTPSATASKVICGYEGGNYFKTSDPWFADPYNSGANYYIGESSGYRTTYNVYPIDLSAAGLTAWQVICNDAPESAQITCSRSDVRGLTAVYKNGYFFLPTGVTPANTEFALAGSSSITVDATNHTITLEYDEKLAILAESFNVYQGYGTTGRGNDKAVLLRIVASPFKDMAAATLNATLTGAENISAVTLYETGNTVEWNAVTSYTNTFVGTINGSTASFNLGANATSGTHYYWLCATVKNDAAVGNVIDAALTGITYNVSGQESVTCNLTSVGNPNTSMKIFDVQKTLFVPTTYSSNYYRIPAVITADDGSIVAAADKRYNSVSDLGNHKIDVIARRSTDGGKTWSEPTTIATGDGSSDAAYGYGDPALVKTASGKIICLMAAGKSRFQDKALKNIAMVTSSDNGATWTSPVDITTNGSLTDNASLPTSFFVTSGKGLCTNDNVVMFLLDAYNSSNAETNYVLYSVDEGQHWIIDATVVCNGANEAKLQQLKDGSLIASIRTNGNRAFNRGTYTNNGDGTLTFSWGRANDDITYSSTLRTGAGNNQDIFYYSTTDVPDILFHTMTTGSHANLNLYMSVDQGDTWNLVQTIQPGGSRYAVMNKLSNGDLGILFEDYSLEAGYSYPITYLTITSEQIEGWYNQVFNPLVKNSVQGSETGANSYGSFSTSNNWSNTWTSNASSGMAGLTISSADNVLNHSSVYDQRCFAMRPSANGATDVITITAPAGYYIDSYTITGRNYSTNQTYQLYVDENAKTTTSTSGATFTVSNVNAPSTSFNFYGSSTSNYLCVTNFTIQLRSKYPVTLKTVGNASYATLYLPFDVTTDANAKAYYITSADNGTATLTEVTNNEIAANTAVVLINDKAAANTTFSVTSGLTQQVSESNNLLKGTLADMTLDLADGTPYYALGKKDDKIGFYKFDNSGTTTITLGANKAYLDTTAPSNPSKGFVFVYDDPTAISNAQTSMLNPQSDNWYTLDGRKLAGKPTAPGIYIVNKKKVLVK